MGSTITEKILARTAGLASVRPGDEIMAKPDFVLTYDFPGYTDSYFRQMKEVGVTRVTEPERFAIFIDHMTINPTAKEEELHDVTRAWCAENGVALVEGRGIGHQVSCEIGYATPGAFAVHFDGHVSQLGTFGTLAMGIRRNVVEAFVRERIPIRVPETVRVNLRGNLRHGVMARDVFHHLVREMGPSSCRFKVLEIGGPGLSGLSIEGLQTVTGLAMFTGALTAIVNPDQERLDYALPRARKKLDPIWSDDDASYFKVYDIDLSDLEPIVVLPPTPANTRNLSDFIGLDIHAGYLGSCVSGRVEDLRVAATILRGRQVKEGFLLHVVPTSHAIMEQADKEGLLSTLAAAGAQVSMPTCDHCFGRIVTTAPNQRAVSTGTLNVRGRMGSPDSEIYLCNAAAVAAAALEGKIADPRKYL